MIRYQVRWRNFRGLKDSGWLEMRPITVIVGPNASGKTSALAPLLLLKQTIESGDQRLALKTIGEYFNAGSYDNLIHLHDKNTDLQFDLRFRKPRTVDQNEMRPVGDYPPNEVSLTFRAGAPGESPVLQKYAVADTVGRPMLTRTRLKSGRYSVRDLHLPTTGAGLHDVIRKSPPEHFLFSVETPFRERLSRLQRLADQQSESSARELKLPISKEESQYLHIVSYVYGSVERLLRRIAYLGPLCAHPRRMYEITGERPHTVGVKGEHAPEILYRERKTSLLNTVNEWVSRFDFGCFLECNSLTDDGAFSMTLKRAPDAPPVNIADTGFGLSQVLPLVVQGFYSDRGSQILAEQPEIHLNPRLQALLADLFVEVAKRDVGTLIETHSEHLLLRLRRLIAEKAIKASDVALYFIERQDDRSAVRRIEIDEVGHIPSDEWPVGFFEESLRDSLALAAAQSFGE